MNSDQYLHILRSEFGYQTSSSNSHKASFSSTWTSLVYYLRIVYVLVHASMVARRGGLDNKRWAAYSHQIVRAVESVGGRMNISGLELVSQQQGPLVYIANHMSLVETLILPGIALAFNNITFVIKEELRHYPVIGPIFRSLNLIAVSRQNPREDLKVVMGEGHKFISNGGSIIIFPQATRSVAFDKQAFNTLGVKLAARADVPLVPVAIKTDFHGNGKWIKDMGPIDPQKTLYFKFGKPIPVEGRGRRTHQQVVEFISQNLTAWGGSLVGNSELEM